MRKLKVLLLMLAILLVIPFGVFADEAVTETTEESKEVKVYFFHGDGCAFCAKAEAWFEEIEEEYGDKFEIVEYEVWYNEKNVKLMDAVIELRKDTSGGVPYIIIGNQSWDGFSDTFKEPILAKIDSEYEQDPSERYDVMDFIDFDALYLEEDNTARDVLILLALVGVVAAGAIGVVVARKNTN